MAGSGLFIGWGEVLRGNEAVEKLDSTMGASPGPEADGTIESVEPVSPSPPCP